MDLLGFFVGLRHVLRGNAEYERHRAAQWSAEVAAEGRVAEEAEMRRLEAMTPEELETELGLTDADLAELDSEDS